jgi:hypothetical protein
MTARLEGKVAVVTGGTTGIGLAVARRFAAEGASVFITGRRQAELDAAVEAVGHAAVGVRADMSILGDIDRLYDVLRQRHAQIDVLMANAGGGDFAPLGSITEEQYERTFGTNVKGTIFTVQKALPLLNAGASVILTGSTTSIKGTNAFSIYSATKAAVRNLARSWMLDLKDRGIRVNVISPGPIETPGLLGLAANAEEEKQLRDMLVASVPLGRLGRPEEVANMALFLASDEASFVNGAEFFVDGGEVQF